MCICGHRAGDHYDVIFCTVCDGCPEYTPDAKTVADYVFRRWAAVFKAFAEEGD